MEKRHGTAGADRRRDGNATYDRSRALVRRVDRMSPWLFVGLGAVLLGALNAGSSYFLVERNPGGMELFGLMRWAALPAVIAAAVRRRQHDSLTAAAQLAGILVFAEMLGLGFLWPMARHEGMSVPALMGAGLGQDVSLSAAAIPIGAVVIWGARRFGDRRAGERKT